MTKKKNEEVTDEEIKQLIEQNEVQKEALKKILKGMVRTEKSKKQSLLKSK
ncbi:MAG: hypothetical protein MI866_00030 [Bacteroidales bacterium]|nr:hypothetical protein [Bacteroidales bacterium]